MPSLAKEPEEEFFFFFYSLLSLSLFLVPILNFSPVLCLKLNTCFSVPVPLCFAGNILTCDKEYGLGAVDPWEHTAISAVWHSWRSEQTPGTRPFKQSSREHEGNNLIGDICQATKIARPCGQFCPAGFQAAKKGRMALASRVIYQHLPHYISEWIHPANPFTNFSINIESKFILKKSPESFVSPAKSLVNQCSFSILVDDFSFRQCKLSLVPFDERVLFSPNAFCLLVIFPSEPSSCCIYTFL